MKKKKNFKDRSKPRWQQKKEQQEQKYSQFDPKIHSMSKQGIGFGLRKDYKEKPGEASGSNLKDLFDKWSWTKKEKDEDKGSSGS
jgi:hypothetical protein